MIYFFSEEREQCAPEELLINGQELRFVVVGDDLLVGGSPGHQQVFCDYLVTKDLLSNPPRPTGGGFVTVNESTEESTESVLSVWGSSETYGPLRSYDRRMKRRVEKEREKEAILKKVADILSAAGFTAVAKVNNNQEI